MFIIRDEGSIIKIMASFIGVGRLGLRNFVKDIG